MMQFLDRASELVARALAVLAGLFLISMMLLACANMVLRSVFGMPVQGTFELMGFLGAVVAAFSLAFAQRRKAHVSVGILLARFPAWFRRLADASTNALSCGFFLLAGVETWKWALFLVQTGEVSETLQIVFHPFVFASAAGCIALAFVLAVDTLKALTQKKVA
ncbi:tripartite ATP-independent periplasmic transporter, DctQ component, putative [Pseudodesulfovibrio mercurii]|uniref:Tripartite ATP-independent periplasmic transporter, DctQ component, putative n=1 Tax=Pseudodesulfovibrio mercurii TaxID=641491 RepID=F0JJE9_9BACT|nr:TRAP transporter small permease [Pseudodesulfovibrio mercurii]EGB16048.1 tripartite ATP-independent periplasmic transporter, DctQ component, putative [Pseudodesulfovibrio mercurii]